MIELHLKADFETHATPFVAKVRIARSGDSIEPSQSEIIARASSTRQDEFDCISQHGPFKLFAPREEAIDGDVLLCMPSRGIVNRLFRRSSRHNTLLLTERCDQLCVMCSQPPKNSQDEWRFVLYEQALMLADQDIMVGISGGEPTLYKKELLGMIDRVSTRRPDLSYHILSNGQHFTTDDEDLLRSLHERVKIVWGIPLYSLTEMTHDEIVGKKNAFSKVLDNLFLLASTNASIELRTVITSLNVLDLPHLANFIAKNIPFIADWAIMAMEPIGYAKANWQRLFFDHSEFPQPILNTLEICELRGLPCHLYNVPRCTIPAPYRRYCVDSISDWKKKFLPECDGCREQAACSGFFEWYSPKVAWAKIAPVRGELAPSH